MSAQLAPSAIGSRAIDQDDEAQLLDTIERWVERDVRPVVKEFDHADRYPVDLVERMKEFGLFGATISTEYGGLGLPASTYAQIVMRISSVWMALTGIFNSHLIFAMAIEKFGTPEQRALWLPKLVTGEIRGGLALTEPDAGTDLQGIRMTARRDGDHYVINGTKTWISNGIEGSAFALLVKTNPEADPRHKGMSLFIAPKQTGFTVGRRLEKLGYKSIDSGELVFDDYRISKEHLIGGVEGQGFYQATGGLELGRINVAARGVGVAEGALQLAVDYAKVRRTFGKPIAEHQAIQLKIGEMATRARAAPPADARRGRRLRPRPALRHGGRDGEVLRVRGGARERDRVDAHPRRLRLLEGIRHRAALPRRSAHVHRRRHERDAADDHRPPAHEAKPRLVKPLTGLRILALEQFGAGPYGTMFLADLGAEVIKIENPEGGGDASRQVGPHALGPDDSQYFQTFNLSKRSVALDIKSEEGRRAFLDLVRTADAVVNNLRGDLPAKLAIDYAGLRATNPKVVCLHISAYGRGNSRESWPGYDFLMQAESGLMSLTGEPDGPPSRTGQSMIDYMSGITGMVGLLSCVLRARETGQGCDVDTCLFDVAIHQISYSGTWFLNTGEVPRRHARSAHPSLIPVQTVRTADGWIYVMCMKPKFWEILAELIGRPELARDERFATAPARIAHRDELTPLLDEAMSHRTTAEWLEQLSGRVPVAPIYDVDQAFASPFMAEAGMIRDVPHPVRPDFRALANPIKVDGERLSQAACRPLGADNAALLPDGGALGRHRGAA